MAARKHDAESGPAAGAARRYVVQTDVPRHSVTEAVRIPMALATQYGCEPTAPLLVAKALNLKPNSSQFRTLCGAAIAYGLTVGGPNASEIAMTPLARRIAKAIQEDDKLSARREAFLKPRIISEFLRKYDRSPLPRRDISKTVLAEMGVPEERTEEVLNIILEGTNDLSLTETIKSTEYVNLSGVAQRAATDTGTVVEPGVDSIREGGEGAKDSEVEGAPGKAQDSRLRRVFITHGKNRAFIESIKKLLAFGELEAVVAVERQSVSIPVPDKVLQEMRGCGAAIIHVDDEEKLLDKDSNERVVLNPNVLIEIGAAMALYGRRYILLVKTGVSLPSNLQGLLEVRYEGESLNGETTIKLLEAISDIKNHPLPEAALPAT